VATPTIEAFRPVVLIVLVKILFVPYFVVYLTNHLVTFQQSTVPTTIFTACLLIIEACWLTDLAFGIFGYLATLSLLGREVRAIDATALGWAVCLVVYEPFNRGIGPAYLSYEGPGSTTWQAWLEGHDILLGFWVAPVLAGMLIYAWAGLHMGIIYSNLSSRGIVTNGPYRFTKHPHYIFKNIVWWLTAVPFISTTSPFDAARQCLIMLFVNFTSCGRGPKSGF
jgi:protein-S-isoprenylcysteine O-methyltransferase Ste14